MPRLFFIAESKTTLFFKKISSYIKEAGRFGRSPPLMAANDFKGK